MEIIKINKKRFYNIFYYIVFNIFLWKNNGFTSRLYIIIKICVVLFLVINLYSFV